MDGLMVDTEPFYQQAWQLAVRGLGHELSDETFRSFSGKSDADSEAALVQQLGRAFPLREFQALWPALWHAEIRAHGISTKRGILRLLDALQQRGVLPASACIVLEDSDSGARAATSAGMRIIAIPDRHEASPQTCELATAVHESAEWALPTILDLLAR